MRHPSAAALLLAVAAPAAAVPPAIVAPPPALASRYLGQVASRTRVPSSYNATNRQVMTRRGDYARDAIERPQLVFGNFYTSNTGEACPGGTLTVTAAIEYPAGTYTQATFGGAASVVIPDCQARLLSDPVAVAIPRGAQFWTRTWESGSAMALYADIGFNAGSGDAVTFGPSVADSTMTAFTGTGSGVGYGPIAIVAPTRRPAVALVADSRGAGSVASGATPLARPYIGEIAPALAPSYAFLDLSRPSQTAAQAAGGGFARRAEYLQYATHGVIELGINDLASGRTAAQLAADRQTIRGLAPALRWFETTIGPRSNAAVAIAALSSTGTTATATLPPAQAAALAAGQTVTVSGATPAGYNGTVVVTSVAGQSVAYTLPGGASGLAAATTTGYLSDGWASLAFQTPDIRNAERVTFNELVRAGSAGVDGYFDTADATESARNTGLLKAPPLVPGPITGDGTHANDAGYALDRREVEPARVSR